MKCSPKPRPNHDSGGYQKPHEVITALNMKPLIGVDRHRGHHHAGRPGTGAVLVGMVIIKHKSKNRRVAIGREGP